MRGWVLIVSQEQKTITADPFPRETLTANLLIKRAHNYLRQAGGWANSICDHCAITRKLRGGKRPVQLPNVAEAKANKAVPFQKKSMTIR